MLSSNCRIPIYGLAFGYGADLDLVRTISNTSGGFHQQILENFDAAIQLENFYFEVSHPTYDNLKFELIGDSTESEVVVNTKDWNEVYSGSELVIAGRLTEDAMKLKLEGTGPKG